MDGSPKIGRKCAQYFRQLASPLARKIYFESTRNRSDTLRNSSQKERSKMDGSYCVEGIISWIFNFFSWIDRLYFEIELFKGWRQSRWIITHLQVIQADLREIGILIRWILRWTAQSRAKTIACKSNQSFPLREISFPTSSRGKFSKTDRASRFN